MLLPDGALGSYKYRSWIECSPNLSYFSFARYCHRSKTSTDSHYVYILQSLAAIEDEGIQSIVTRAAAKFEKRFKHSGIDSEFFTIYQEYWTQRKERENMEAALLAARIRIQKRQLQAVESVNESICSIIEHKAKWQTRQHKDDTQLSAERTLVEIADDDENDDDDDDDDDDMF